MRLSRLLPSARWAHAGWIAACLAASSTIAPAQTPRHRREADAKALFVLNFIRFVEWPPGGPIEVCSIGDETLATALERRLEGKNIHDRPLRFRTPKPENLASCAILYVSHWRRDLESLLASIGGAPTLTFSELPGFAAKGGMVELMVDREQIRFEINHQGAQRRGLRISSQLLRLTAKAR